MSIYINPSINQVLLNIIKFTNLQDVIWLFTLDSKLPQFLEREAKNKVSCIFKFDVDKKDLPSPKTK